MDLSPSSFDLEISQTAQVHAIVTYSDYSQYYDANSISSANTSVATVSGYAITNPFWATVTAQAYGSTQLDAQSWSYPRDPYGQTYGTFTAQAQVAARCAVPTNFRQTNVSNNGNASLTFTYAWNSSSGRFQDIAACTVEEFVTYPGTPFQAYVWPNPPFPNFSTQNPTTDGYIGSAGTGTDTNFNPTTGYSKPYSGGFTAVQRFQYVCPCANGGYAVVLQNNINIVRTVTANPDGSGTLTISKSGSSSTLALPQ